ncbi:MAG: glucose 1-dehydrogenase [Acidimicrobiia bacterium]|nr:glucose 1-dehydrogenase [Acidimicrobiia bacterium]MBV8303893.1 glucose 1-dehydrogenase [Acidimicrobiia bacterium]
MSGRLDGEVALVTGSTLGIGAGVARLFAAEGARVVVTGRDIERGSAVVDGVDGEAVFVAADLAAPESASRLVDAAVERFGTLTVLVNNAVEAGTRDGPVADVSDQAWARILEVNLLAVARLCRAAIPVMTGAGHGSIVNVSSRAARRASRGLAAYSASKGALEALTRSIAVDYADQGIRCNTVSPGYVLNERRDADLSDERRRRLEAMHLTRLGQPLDVAYAALYLASREAEFVTGILLPVDGGSSSARARTLG